MFRTEFNSIEQNITEIFAWIMRRLDGKEPVYLVIVRSIEDHGDHKAEGIAIAGQKELNNEYTVEINEDKTKKFYPKEVQKIVLEYLGVSSRESPAVLSLQRTVDHKIELLLGAGPPHTVPYRMSSQDLD